MGSRCYYCGEKFGRCYEHGGNCPPDCSFGTHDCPGDPYAEDGPDEFGGGNLASCGGPCCEATT